MPPDERRDRTGLLGLPGRGARALREALALLLVDAAPLDLRLLGRTLWHAALVGTLAGLLGAAFFAGLEIVQRLLLEGLAGLEPLRAAGEKVLPRAVSAPLRPWLLVLLPAAGGVVAGLLIRLAPLAAGGGGDATIEAYHRRGGFLPARVLPVKLLASLASLGSGGSGGREGPTMLMGGAAGSIVASLTSATPRERRILLVAGVAAGIAAVFRTPLGAALLAAEFLYRDDFEGDAVVPAMVASVIAYAIATPLLGAEPLFGTQPRYAFVAAHLPLYAGLAVAIALASAMFRALLAAARRVIARLPGPAFLRPAAGGLATGLLGVGTLLWASRWLGPAARRYGVFGGGYGLAQAALSAGPGLPGGWPLVGFLLALAAAKMAATAFTIGSGGSAGDFAPSLVVGGLLGGAWGQATAMLTGDPRIQVGAFALVGMGTFYGGVAHVPLAALVLVAELAGSYDLLVPMMLSVAIAITLLRRVTLYPAQPGSKRDSPLHRLEMQGLAGLDAIRIQDVMVPVEAPGIAESAPIAEVLRCAAMLDRQRVVPVLGADGAPRGLIDAAVLRPDAVGELAWTVAADLMGPLLVVGSGDTLRRVGELLAEGGARQVAVVEDGRVVGFAGADEVARAALAPLADPGGSPAK
jgi:CIC family chloride channel protein